MKKIQTLNEQLNRMKGLMNFKLGQNSHDTLSDKLMNEQKKVDPKDLENVKPSDTIGIGTDPEKKETPKVSSKQTKITGGDIFKGTIQDIYNDLGTCKGILKQVRNLALSVGGTPLSILIKNKQTYGDFLDILKKTQSILDNDIKKGDKSKNSRVVQSILDYSKKNLDENCVKKLQENLLKYTESKNEIETPEGKKEYTDGIVGLLTLKGYVDAEIAYYKNVFSKTNNGIKDVPYGKFKIDTSKGDTTKGITDFKSSRGDIEDVDQETKTKQSLKDN